MIMEAAKKYIRFRMYFNRGMSYVNDFRNLFYFAVGFKILGLDTALSAALAAGCGLLIFLIGVADIDRIKIMQFEAKMLTNYNPVMRDIHENTNRSHRSKRGRTDRNTDSRHN